MSDSKRSAAKIHLLRIVNGEGDIQSMDIVVRWLRSIPNCPKTIREIGDLIAHPEERTKGPVKDALEHAYRALVYRIITDPKMGPDPKISLDGAFVEKLVKVTSRVVNPSVVRSEIVLGVKEAVSVALNAIQKINFIQRGYYHIHKGYTKKEERVLNFFTSTIYSNPFFDHNTVRSELEISCKSSGILDDEVSIDKLYNFFIICAIIHLHGASFDIGDELTSTTFLHIDAERRMDVYGSVKVPEISHVDFRFQVLSTNFNASDWCSADLLMSDQKELDRHSLEFKPDRRLYFLA